MHRQDDAHRMIETSESLNARLAALHAQLLEKVPSLDRIACALYDPGEDQLKTFINSTRSGRPIAGYSYPLSHSPSLSQLARSGDFRVLDDIASAVHGNSEHSAWLLAQGYRSSFTVPIYHEGQLLGFIFFDSTQPAVFSAEVQRDLVLYCNLIGMSISNEITALRAMMASTRVIREMATLRDFETGMHLERMARYSRLIAHGIAARHGLSDEFVEQVYLFAPLHDIGKVGIPDKILLKPGRLDPDEQAIMQTHVDKGLEIIARVTGPGSGLPDSAILRNIVHCHHEYLDGSGYPRGITAADIPTEARIVTVADIFDALTTLRPYKKIWTPESALAELRQMSAAGKLDETCVEALAANFDEIERIHLRYMEEEDLTGAVIS